MIGLSVVCSCIDCMFGLEIAGGLSYESIIQVVDDSNIVSKNIICEQLQKMKLLEVKECNHQNVEDIKDCIYTVVACKFVEYFSLNKFGSSNIDMSVFSLLPPIIRYKTLEILFDKDDDNVYIVDKLCLSMLKTFDYDRAISWIDNHEKKLRAMKISMYYEKASAYEMCYQKIEMMKNELKARTPYVNIAESRAAFYEQLNCGSIDESCELVVLIKQVYDALNGLD